MITPIKPLSTILADLQVVISDLTVQITARDAIIDRLSDSLAAITPPVVIPPVVVPPVMATLTSNIDAVVTDGITDYPILVGETLSIPPGFYSFSGENGSEGVISGSGHVSGPMRIQANGSLFELQMSA